MSPSDDELASRSPRPFPNWPDWRCVAIDAGAATVCGLRATRQLRVGKGFSAPWTYCERHAPELAEPIPPDAPYYVTRLELRVAVTGAPGDRALARDEAVARVTHAIEAAGGLVVDLHVAGRTASRAAASGPPLRLQLAGAPEPSPRSALVTGAPVRPAWCRPVHKRKVG